MSRGGWFAGLHLATSMLTVLPVGFRAASPATAARAARMLPLVGVGLGAVAAGVSYGLSALGASGLLAGILTVAVLVLATRGMHVDGLADTTDALGSYRPPDEALAIMKSPEIGPFGVAAVVLVLGAEAASFAALALSGRWLAVGLAVAVGRVAMCWSCRRGLPAARPSGLGALWASSVPVAAAGAWVVVVGAVAFWAVPARPWQGPVAVVVAVLVAELLCRHARRRFGGTTGDVMGASGELAVVVSAVVLALGIS